MNWKTMTQMDPSVIEAMSKSKERLELREPITPDELYSLMEQEDMHISLACTRTSLTYLSSILDSGIPVMQ